MKQRTKKILLSILTIGLLLPVIQYHSKLIIVKELSGAYHLNQKPEFSWDTWFDIEYQNQYELHFNDYFGFRSDFVRIHNQIDYSLFNEYHTKGVVIGKNDYLFEKGYIDSYFGTDFIGRNKIHSTLKTIDSIYQELKIHNTELLIIIAPGKGYFYPEYIPDSLTKEPGITNYKVYIEELSKMTIPYIDFNDLFLKMKDTSSIILYPKTGIHWSQGIIPFVMDSIIKKVEHQLDQDLPDITWTYPNPATSPDRQDADIERSLNLLFPLKTPPMMYPDIKFETKGEYQFMPKTITVADSFWWQLFNKKIGTKSFKNSDFWYYFNESYSGWALEKTDVKDLNIKAELLQSDIVILMTTEANLHQFPFGFTKSLDHHDFNKNIYELKIQNLIKYIKTDKKWFDKVQEKAKNRGISVDSMLYLDAKYNIEKKFK